MIDDFEPIVFRLIGGPLDGELSELPKVMGHPLIPDAIGEQRDGMVHWYEIHEELGTATYVKSEPDS